MRISDWSSDVCSSDLRPSRANSVQEQVEAVAAGAELELGIGIDGIVVNRLSDRALNHVGDARDQHDQVRDVANGLIGVADPVVDMDGARGRDHADEETDADERLKRSEETTTELQS